MNPVDEFIQLIQAASGERSRVDLDQLWRVFLQWKPELAANSSKRAELERWLTEAAATGRITLPRGKKLFDRTAMPPLPLWVALRVEKAQADCFDHKAYPWSPGMSFVAGFPFLPNPDDALALNRFFLEEKDSSLVPTKERSYRIFGDEKRLGALLKGVLFTGLTLEKLRCYDPMLVPVHRVFETQLPRVLILENEASFDSFCRWNSTAGVWGTIVFGRGLEIWKAVDFLFANWEPATRYDYLGDFDQEGVCIAARLAESMNERGRALLPLKSAYSFLSRQKTVADAKEHSTDWPSAVHWLNDFDIITAASEAFKANRRVAQEAFGWEQLLRVTPAMFNL